MNHSTDIVIHINESLDSKRLLGFSNQVQEITGVRSVSCEDARPHLMIIDYNPSQTKAKEVLNGINKTGMHAKIVGWL